MIEIDNKDKVAGVLGDKIVLQPQSKDGCLRRCDVKMFEVLFENILDTFFYIKDNEGHWISCNTTSLELLNLTKVSEVIGVKEDTFFPKQIAEDIRLDDLKILNNGESILNRIELITNNFGELIWVSTNKLPVFDIDERVIGIIGVTKPIVDQSVLPRKYELFNETISFIRENLAKPIRISDLSKKTKLSESQFRRRFNLEFGLPPQQFILRTRIQAAANLLRNQSSNISSIAAQSGFSDQSYFTRQFKEFYGETPKAYRRSWQTTSHSQVND